MADSDPQFEKLAGEIGEVEGLSEAGLRAHPPEDGDVRLPSLSGRVSAGHSWIVTGFPPAG